MISTPIGGPPSYHARTHQASPPEKPSGELAYKIQDSGELAAVRAKYTADVEEYVAYDLSGGLVIYSDRMFILAPSPIGPKVPTDRHIAEISISLFRNLVDPGGWMGGFGGFRPPKKS